MAQTVQLEWATTDDHEMELDHNIPQLVNVMVCLETEGEVLELL
jgi:hypothetical protein